MNLSIWKTGLFVALLTGLFTGLGALEISDSVNWLKLGLFVLACVAKDALLYLKTHPIDSKMMVFGILALTLTLCPGCASFSTTQTDLSYDEITGKPQRQITTKASARTFFDAKSQLAKFAATQTDKSQSAKVGSLSSETSGTNALNALIELRRIAEALPK